MEREKATKFPTWHNDPLLLNCFLPHSLWRVYFFRSVSSQIISQTSNQFLGTVYIGKAVGENSVKFFENSEYTLK